MGKGVGQGEEALSDLIAASLAFFLEQLALKEGSWSGASTAKGTAML